MAVMHIEAEIEVRDPDDAWVLASALAGNADILVTGDRDLLAILQRGAVHDGTRRPARRLSGPRLRSERR
jgi:predicted nucleic acid-binding protein